MHLQPQERQRDPFTRSAAGFRRKSRGKSTPWPSYRRRRQVILGVRASHDFQAVQEPFLGAQDRHLNRLSVGNARAGFRRPGVKLVCFCRASSRWF